MSTIKDITVKLGKNRYVTTTVVIYGRKDDNEYTVPEEDNAGRPLDSEEREFVMKHIEAKIIKLRIDEDEMDDISDDYEDSEVHVEEHY